MKELTPEVKDKAAKKWSKRFKTRKEFRTWWGNIGITKCSLCYRFSYCRECPLEDTDSFQCCREFMVVKVAYRENSSPRILNTACEAMQNRIRSLKVGE